jgi:hypothetical protein
MLGLALVQLLAGDPQPVDDGIHRGTGWYVAGAAVPEPPVALALVIVGVAGMRVRERRRQARGA